jgi:hypothetical protein
MVRQKTVSGSDHRRLNGNLACTLEEDQTNLECPIAWYAPELVLTTKLTTYRLDVLGRVWTMRRQKA